MTAPSDGDDRTAHAQRGEGIRQRIARAIFESETREESWDSYRAAVQSSVEYERAADRVLAEFATLGWIAPDRPPTFIARHLRWRGRPDWTPVYVLRPTEGGPLFPGLDGGSMPRSILARDDPES